jgi:hypothetical protein
MHYLDDPREYMREKISLAEALVARSQWPGTTAILAVTLTAIRSGL